MFIKWLLSKKHCFLVYNFYKSFHCLQLNIFEIKERSNAMLFPVHFIVSLLFVSFHFLRPCCNFKKVFEIKKHLTLLHSHLKIGLINTEALARSTIWCFFIDFNYQCPQAFVCEDENDI